MKLKLRRHTYEKTKIEIGKTDFFILHHNIYILTIHARYCIFSVEEFVSLIS